MNKKYGGKALLALYFVYQIILQGGRWEELLVTLFIIIVILVSSKGLKRK